MFIAPEPTVAEAVAHTDEIETLMKTLEPVECQALEFRLQDKGTFEIANEIEYSPRTVHRILERVKAGLSIRFTNLDDPT